MLDKIDQLGIANDTLVLCSTDNGPRANTWPNAATTPFRSETDTNLEGAYRVPAEVGRAGQIKPNTVSTEIFHAMDWLPTFVAMAGDPDITNKLLSGYTIGDMTYKVHLDGYNKLPQLTSTGPSARHQFFYFSDDGDLMCVRWGNWKAVFEEQRSQGTLEVWAERLTPLRVPKLFNLRTDPFERGYGFKHLLGLVPITRLSDHAGA